MSDPASDFETDPEFDAMSDPEPDDLDGLIDELASPAEEGGVTKGPAKPTPPDPEEAAFLDRIEALLRDPLKLIAHNNAHRQSGEDMKDLLTIDQVRQLQERGPYPHMYPTITTHEDEIKIPALDQAEYNTRYAERRVVANAVMSLLAIAFEDDNHNDYRIVTSGGGPMAPYLPTTKQTHIQDDDFFLVNCGADESKMWKSAGMWVRAVKEAFDDPSVRKALGAREKWDIPLSTLATPGLITITGQYREPRGWAHHLVKLQLILQRHAGCSIYGFDIPSCCIEHDGRVTRVTPYGAYAIVTGANLVVPEYGSSSYDYRLVKKTHLFDLTMPHMDPQALKPAKSIVVGDRLKITTIGAPDEAVQFADLCVLGDARPVSDYEPSGEGGFFSYSSESIDKWINLANLVSGSSRMCVISDGDSDFVSWVNDASRVGPPLPSTIFTKDALNGCLDRIEDDWVLNANGEVQANHLSKFFGMSPAQIEKFTHMVKKTQVGMRLQDRKLNKINVKPALARFRHKITQRYNALITVKNEPLQWWYDVTDRDGVYTSSFNPRPMSPEEWYRDAYTKPTPLAVESSDKAVVATDEPQKEVCCICLCELMECSSTIKLSCGHSMHLANPPSCSGILGWTDAGKYTCPQCRAVFTTQPGDSDDKDEKVELDVNWSDDE
jgi:hypothetical protein